MLCKIGDVEVWRVLDLNAPFRTPAELFPTAGPDVATLIETRDPGAVCRQTGGLILPIQGFLLRGPRHLVLVDACLGNHKSGAFFPPWQGRNSQRFLQGLAAAGAAPKDVDYVMCTHLHVDHVGWNTQLLDGRWVPTFPNARYLFPSADMRDLAPHLGAIYDESINPIIEAGQSENVSAGHRLGDEIALIPTPGHTPGHFSVLIESRGHQAIITGDAIHSVAQCWHPDWQFRYDSDPEEAVASRRKLLERSVESQATILGTHFTLPSIGCMHRHGDVFAWAPR